jgi:hypothetical protein
LDHDAFRADLGRGQLAPYEAAILTLHRVWSLGDLDEIVGTDPFLESGLHVLGLELQRLSKN